MRLVTTEPGGNRQAENSDDKIWQTMPIGTCKLCLTKGVELQDSHFLPAAASRSILKLTGKAPVNVTPGLAIQRNERVSDYVLCAACEQRFSKNGEYEFFRCCVQARGGFPMKELLDARTPIDRERYVTAGIPEIDISRLTYFASSIMWRASAHKWGSEKHPPIPPSLGSYEDGLRQYLLGETDFPENIVLLIGLIPDPQWQAAAVFPYGGKISLGYCRYKFILLGVAFLFLVGKSIPTNLRLSCTYRSPEKFIFMGAAVNEMFIRDLGPIVKDARSVGSLRGQG